jgi:cytochrome P450
VFQLEALATNLTFDVIGRAALGIRLDEQTRAPGPLRRALLDQLTHCLFDYNILTLGKILSPIRQWKMARNTRVMRQFLRPHVIRKLQGSGSARTGHDSPTEGTTIVDFAVKEWNEEAALKEGPYSKRRDGEFIDIVIAQLKLFLFAGHDTTATSICWVLRCLAKHPGAATLVRAEHDAVLGAGTEETMKRLRASPRMLHQLPYTLACVKEALRLWPSVGPIRDGSSSFSFTVPGTSVSYPTEGFMIWDGIRAVMRWEHLWVRPLDFIPERWLASPGDPLYQRKMLGTHLG